MISANSAVLLVLCFVLAVYATTQTSPNLVVNPTCSLPYSTGWTGPWECTGNYLYPNTQSSDSESYQIIDLVPFQQYIAYGGTPATAVFNVGIWTAGDQAGLWVNFLDANKNVCSACDNIVSYATWTTTTLQGAVPANTHYIKLEIVCRYISGTGYCRSWFENLSLTLTYNSPASVLYYGLNGARGSSYKQTSNLLYFVESTTGYLSTYSVIRPLQNASQVDTVRTVGVNQRLDLVTGVVGSGGDFILDMFNWGTQTNAGPLNLRPQGTCEFSLLGNVPYTSLNQASLQGLLYTNEYINFNLLQPGFVFAVYNYAKQPAGNFDYAKVLVTAYSASAQTVTLQFTTYNLVGSSGYQVIGYGFQQPQDVKVTSDGKFAYITEGAGSLVRVDLTSSNKNRTGAFVVTTGLNNPRELQLDETHHIGYTVENAVPGTLWAVDLFTGTKNAIISSLSNSSGLIIDSAFANAYVSELPSNSPSYAVVSKINLITAIKTTFAPSFTYINSLTWYDSSQSGIIISEPNYNSIHLLNIAFSPATSSVVWQYPYVPESVVVTSPGQILVVQDSEISQYTLYDPAYNFLGPSLLGIGNVPVTADTQQLPQITSTTCKTLLSEAHSQSWSTTRKPELSALSTTRYPTMLYDGVVQTNAWNDYKWDATANQFVVTTTSVDSYSRFPVRQLGTIWYNYWLGYFLDTTVYSDNQAHTITVELFDSYNNLISAGTSSVVVFIDNNWPHALIKQIYHLNDNGTIVPVAACDIVTGTSDQFTFNIDASDLIGQNLLSWNLVAYWGANQAGAVASDSYSAHTSSVKWQGPYYATVPSPAWSATVHGDPTSRSCAHTFSLGVWDRSQNGWGYLHYSSYQISVTFMLTPLP